MMRINAAYHAGDLAALQQLAALPDPELSILPRKADERRGQKTDSES